MADGPQTIGTRIRSDIINKDKANDENRINMNFNSENPPMLIRRKTIFQTESNSLQKINTLLNTNSILENLNVKEYLKP